MENWFQGHRIYPDPSLSLACVRAPGLSKGSPAVPLGTSLNEAKETEHGKLSTSSIPCAFRVQISEAWGQESTLEKQAAQKWDGRTPGGVSPSPAPI